MTERLEARRCPGLDICPETERDILIVLQSGYLYCALCDINIRGG